MKLILGVMLLAVLIGIGATVAVYAYQECRAKGHSASYCRGDRWPG